MLCWGLWAERQAHARPAPVAVQSQPCPLCNLFAGSFGPGSCVRRWWLPRL